MNGANCSLSRSNSFSNGKSGELSKIITKPQQDNSQQCFLYKDLINFVGLNGTVRFEQDSHFLVITPYAKVNTFNANAPFLGWKLHVSVKLHDLEQAYRLAMPIISHFSLCFKVINSKVMKEDRFLQGAQITIYLEEDEKIAITEEELGKLVEQIHREFLLHKLEPGKSPVSDAETISSFFSIRNDKYKPFLGSTAIGYMSARVAGKHFNPMNYPNPFRSLLRIETSPFDALEHFLLFDLPINDGNISYRLIDTMKACISEYTTFDTLDEGLKDAFILQFCSENGSDNAHFFKDDYKNKPDIFLAVKLAFYIVFIFEVDSGVSNIWYYEYVDLAQLSKQYPYENSFKKLMKILEDHSKKQIDRYMIIPSGRTYSLIDLYVRTKMKQQSINVFPLTNGGKNSYLIGNFK